MSPARARKEASKRLALKLQADYRALVEARGADEVQAAAIMLGDTFNTNIEFVINVLRDYGGLQAKFEPMTKREPAIIGIERAPANDAAALADKFKKENGQ